MGKFSDKLEPDIFTDYDGTITEASFQFNEYGGQMKFVVDEIDGKEQPQFEFYKIPGGWESPDGGETIIRTSGDGKGIVKSSQWGKFLMAVDDLGIDDLPEEAMTDAKHWVGLRLRWEVTAAGKGKAYNFTDEKTGEKKEGQGKDKNYPVAFLGKDSQVSATMPSSGAGSTNGQDSLSVLTDIDPVTGSKIQELAKTLPHGEWFKASYAALTEAGIQASEVPDLVAAMGGRGLYESLGGKG